MMTSEEFARPVRQLSAGVVNYINLRINHVSLIIGKRMAELTTTIVTVTILAGFATMVLLMLTLAFVSWYGSTVGSYTHGLLIVSAFYIVAGLIIFFSREKLISDPVVRLMNKRKMFTDIKELGENIPVNSLDDLEKRIELMKLQLQHSELLMEQNLQDVSENLKPSRIISSILDQTFSSTAVTGKIVSKLLTFFLEKRKKKKAKKEIVANEDVAE
jgi:hypothetical protein